MATFNDLQFNAADSYTLNANSGSFSEITSGTIVVNDVSLATDFFRSKQTGNWNSSATWETSHDGNDPWIPTTLTPTTSANTVTIRNGHIVTISATTAYDQVIVDSGGQVTVASTVTSTLADGTGTDLIINGTWLNSGGTWTTTGTWQVNSGGTYIHNTTSGVSSPLDSATLNTASNFIYRGSSALAPSSSFSGRTYGNLSFESTSGSWTASAAGAGALTINGDFTIGSGVTYTTTQTGVMTFAGNFTNNGTLTNNTGTQVYTFTGTNKTIGGTGAINFETWNVNSGANISLTSNVSIASTFTGTISGTLNTGTSAVTGAGAFTLAATGTLGIGSPAGLSTTAATGNIQISGARTYTTGSTFVYNGNANQAVGNGLPATVTNLTIANTGTAPTNIVSGVTDQGVSANFNIQQGTYLAGSGTLTVLGNFSNSGTFTANGGSVQLTGTGTQNVSGTTTFFNLFITTSAARGVNFASGSTTTVSNSFLAQGAGAGNLISLRSTNTGTAWNLVIVNQSLLVVNFVDVRDSDASGGQTVIANNSTNTANNVNWSFSAGTISFKNAPYTDSETNANHTKAITLQRTGGVNNSVSVRCATSNGTATAGSDYTSTSVIISWNEGDASDKTCNIPIIGDTTQESDETVNLTLSAPTGGVLIGGTNPTTLTIVNDDFAPAFTDTIAQTRRKGAAAVNATIANVTDDNGVGTVTVTATTVPAGISVTNIVNTGGAITADVSADCAAASSANTVVLTASDGTNTTTANLTVNVTESEIEVSGSGTPIADGDPTPDTADHTDFGTVINGAGFSRTFTISNSGSADLHLTGTPLVSISGANAGDFLVTAQPSSTIASGSPTVFTIKFTPGAAGMRSATVSIDSDDCDENPFNFSIQGNGATAKFRSAASGSWNNVLTWEMSADGTNWIPADHTPTASDDTILIQSIHTVTLTANVSADQLSVASGGTFEINDSVSMTLGDGAGEDLNIDGSTNIKGAGAIQGAGSLTLGAAATLRLGGAVGIEAGNPAANIRTTGAKTYLPGDTVIFNGIINQAVGANFPATVTNLTIDNTGAASNDTVTGNAGQTVSGTLHVQTGTYHGASSYNVVQIDTGATWTAGAGETINITGNWTSDGTFNANGSTVVFNGGAAQAISGTAPSIFDFLTIDNSAGVNISGNTQTHQALTLSSGTLSVGALKVLTIDSNVNVAGGSLASDVNGTVNYAGSASQVVIPAQYGNLGFTGAKTLSAAGIIRISNVFTPSTTTGHTTTGSTVEYNGAGAQTVAQISYDNLSSSNTGARTIAGTIRIAGAFSPGTNSYTTIGSTIVFNGGAAQTIPSLAGGYNNLSTTNAAGTTLGGDVTAAGTLAIQAGIFDQGAAANLSAGAVSVSAGAAWHNFGTGDVNLGGGVSNAGTISFDANGAGCGSDDILIRSIGGAVQRAWSGTGTFSMSDVDVKNQGGTAIITVNSGTNSGGNALNWIFVPTCAGGYYTWNGATLADWNVAANWTPARVTPNVSDILIIDGGVTSSPIILNVPTQTIAALRVTNGAQAELRAVSANTTLTVSGATGTDLSVPFGTMLKYGGTNALTISVATGSRADIGGLLLLDGASHRLIGNAAGAVNFLADAICTTSATFTGNAFGDGSAGSGTDGSVIFRSGSTYFHNAGNSPFGSASATVAVFQTGSTAVWLKNEGFQASGRTYANLVVGSIDPGGIAVNLASGGTGDFSFDNLTINSTNTLNSSLTFNGSGAGAVNIGGDITSSGIGNGAVVSDVSLTAGTGGINLTKNGTQTFGGGSGRTVTFGSSAQTSGSTTLALSRNLIVSAPFVLTANSLTGGAGGYVIGNLKMNFTATEAKIFHVGTANGYSPVDANVTLGTGTLTVKAVQNKLPAIPGNRALNRYWTLEEGASPITADLTFHYLDADFAAPTVETNFRLYKFDGVLSQVTSTLDAANNKATANGITDFSDWTLAEPAAVSTGSVQFVQSTYSVNENGTSIDVFVSRTGGAGGAASVSYATSGGSAASGQDFASTSGTLTWADGDASPKTISVPIADDTIYEGSEDFTVSLSGASGASLGTPNSATVNINDNESAPTVAINDVAQAEGDSGASNFTFTITRTGDTAFGTVVNFHTVNGTAAAGTDYTAISSGSITFSASETTKTFNVSVTGDAVYETNETFTVELDSASNATITDNQGLGTILNDDAANTVNVSLPSDLTALTNTVLTVPVTVSNTTGNNSYSFSISYNQSIISPAAVPYNTAGTLSSGSTVTPNISAPGVLGITANGSLSGAGTLIELKFNVVGTPTNCSSLSFTSFTFDNANAVVSGAGGMCVRTGNVSGRVTYGTSSMLQIVPGVAVNAAGLPNLSATTDAGGLYNLSGFGAGAYTLTPSKSGDVAAGTFSGFDASLAARYAVGIISLDSNQRDAADASGNGSVTSFDASLIAQYAVGVTINQPNQTGNWKFVQPDKSYPNIWTDYASEDFTAVLKGDVSGNWTPSGSFAGSSENNSKPTPVRITMADASVTAGDEIVIPINISDVTNRGVYSFDFEIQFDGNVFDIDEDNITALSGNEEESYAPTDFAGILPMPSFVEKTGSLSRNYSLAVKRTAKGTLRITGYGVTPLEGAGELLRLKFRAKSGAGAVKSRITWSAAGLNEGGEIPVLAEGAVIGIRKPVE